MSVQIIYFLCRIQRRKYLLKTKHDEKLTMSIFRKTNKVAKRGLHVSGHFLSNNIPRQFDSNMLRDVPRLFVSPVTRKKIQTSLTSSSTFQYTSLRYKFFYRWDSARTRERSCCHQRFKNSHEYLISCKFDLKMKLKVWIFFSAQGNTSQLNWYQISDLRRRGPQEK